MRRFDLNTIAPSPWKNGGGSTQEIACWPPGAGMAAFDWRISVAMIAQDGPFSSFPGVDRQIMLLQGDGVHLADAPTGLDHALAQPWQAFAFDGGLALDCRLLGGACTDFNVMARRGRWRAQVRVQCEPVQAGAHPAGLVMALRGHWAIGAGGALLAPGQGLWWAGVDAAPLTLAAQSGDACLVEVALWPAASSQASGPLVPGNSNVVAEGARPCGLMD